MEKVVHFVAILGCILLAAEAMAMPDQAGNRGRAPGKVKNRKEAMYYLNYFNHMAKNETEMTDTDMKEAIKGFQRMANVSQTGELDNATMTMMNMARCGVRDNMGMTVKERKGASGRVKRYEASRRWPEDEITWRVNPRYKSTDISETQVNTIMQRALETWASVANIQFRHVTDLSVSVDFDISFVTGAHLDDESPFDGEGGVLAHAYFPNGYAGESIAGDAHFDDHEQFTDGTYYGTNLFQVAVHEFGHSLGLGHSEIESALMAPFYRGYQPDFKLHEDDIAGIRYLYGENTGVPDATMKPDYPTEAGPAPGPACPGFDLDAVVTTYVDGTNFRTFILKGSQIWEINEKDNVRVGGYPKAISDVFKGLPNDVDAAIYFYGRTTFFKGSTYYTYFGTSYIEGPLPISSGWSGLPNNIDSAFVWSGNGWPYVTKGDKYYRYNPYNKQADTGYPRPLSAWADANPPRFDAAFQSEVNMRTYFFYQDQFYRFDDANFDKGNPYDIGKYWFGCSSSSAYAQGGGNGALRTVLPSAALVTLTAVLTVIM